ncbi:hypothetical protein [Mesorhizobium sp. DCY119]|uniref:hypothetical protein n=1 Tax=Mesorhizobium sp. DCY119 TaxID=2108445 RepID=UPI000E6C62F9|nr:hypothetical protein [Mesorhizobium sp. DCY119]RJG43582.1 hypothetical protein D3Y55_04425 [Mesorhizobium sp. DCY119]
MTGTRSIVLAAGLTALMATGSFPAYAQDSKTTNQAIDEALGNHAQYETVIKALQQGVKGKDAKAVAALVNYPISVKISGKDTEIKSEKDFVTHYDAIFTPKIAKVVEDQKYEDLFVNYQGIMFGDGQVWINGICKDSACKAVDAKIVTIQDGP